MNTRMSMRERREKIAELVQNDPRVQACSIEFEAVQTDTTCDDPFDTDIHDDTGTPCAEATGETDTSADADEASCTCAMCQALDALDNLERDNLTVKVILMPVHEGPSEYEEEGEQ